MKTGFRPKLNKISIPMVHIWHKEYGYIGEANEIEFDDFRLQIVDNLHEGYYITDSKEGNPIEVDAMGHYDIPTQQQKTLRNT